MARAIPSLTASCLVALMVWLSPILATSKDYVIDSREYKLILDESKLDSDPQTALKRLWDDLKSAIDESVGMKANGAHRYSGHFGLSQERTIRYWDTDQCVLEKQGYSLRERVKVVKGQEQGRDREITLKFRSPDLYLAAKTDVKARHAGAKRKFEEDIVPLGVEAKDEKDGQPPADKKPSFRSIYSFSTTQRISSDYRLINVDDLFHLFPKLEDDLREDGGAAGKDEAIAMVSNLSLYERTYDGPQVDLGNVTAEFTVSLWYLQADGALATPLVAELTFKYPLGREAEKVARIALRRAMSLFSRMQAVKWASPSSVTKTTFVYRHANFCR